MGRDEIRLAATYAHEKASDVRELTDITGWTGECLLENVYEEDWHTLAKYVNAEIQIAQKTINAFNEYIEKLEYLKSKIKEDTK